ncbi:hypothetical protein [Vibrio sp. SCSIO 43169]|uniref:hypothetical protein n=1 Tax=Vibrio sp. SCSIO 43169 TaxID=2822801 RepID=UPI002043920B|nr:hypothetical protein [Vibrio sp. SCSIO 43169]MCM5509790.1 hypothetical protein [Vibrio sp. SCSIO 43169]
MASSVGVWLESENIDDIDVNLEVHVNYWSLAKDEINYLDVGIKLIRDKHTSDNTELYQKLESVNIYLPFEKKHIEYDSELGFMVCKDQELLSAIFNSYIEEYSHMNDSGIHNITLPDGEELSFFTQIDLKNGDGLEGVKLTELIDKKENGTLLSFPGALFKVAKGNVKNSVYFRFRIKLLDEKAIRRISTITKPKYSVLLGDLNKTEIVDFRLNEARNLPFKIRAKVNSSKPLNTIHFFLIREAISDFKASHSNYKRCRVLETDIWDKYLGLDDTKSQYLIYHWSEKAKDTSRSFIDHFSAFAKFTSNQVSIRLVLVVIFVTFMIGVVSGVFGNLFWHKLTSDKDIEWNLSRTEHQVVPNLPQSMYWPPTYKG